jgi:MFS family permease
LTGRIRISRIVITAVAYTGAGVLPLFLFGANAVRIQSDLGFGTTQLGLAVSSFFAAGALTAPRIGVLIDRFGSQMALRIGMGFSLTATIAIGLVANSWWMAAIGLALCGISHAFVQLALNRLIVETRASSDQGLAFGIKQASVPLSSLLAGLGTAVLAPDFAWNWSFAIAGGVALALGFLVPNDSEPPMRSSRDPELRPGTGLKKLALTAALAAGAGNSLTLLIVDSFDAYGFSDAIGAAVLGIGSGLAAVTRLAGGWTVDRRGSDGFTELRTLLVTGSAGMAMIVFSGASLPLLSLGTLVAFIGGWGWQGIVFYSATRDRRLLPATASGVVLSGTMSGSVIGPTVIAVVADNLSYDVAWCVAAFSLLVSAISVRAPGESAVRAP